MNYHPLVVDLDGTLIRTDMLYESALKLLRDNPFEAVRIPIWLSQGKAVLKRHLADLFEFDPGCLPYNEDLVDWLKQQRNQGRKLILCTASDLSIANVISNYLGIFEEVMGSDGTTNLKGTRKAEMLERRFGHGGFDYAGDSDADLAVWRHARRAVVVHTSVELVRQAEGCCEVERFFQLRPMVFSDWRRVLRVHQWLKNLLLFVPMFAAHELTAFNVWVTLVVAFFSFNLCASSVYITNDLMDLESDRNHPRKRGRPFASGLVPVWKGVALTPLLLIAGLALGTCVDGGFLPWLICYFVLTCAYSWGLKRLMLVDCLVLAMLYTLRIVAGAAAAGLSMSFWLLAFSVFLFLSLAFLKRYAELKVQSENGKEKAHGRGYFTSDAQLIQTMGITSGHTAVLVLALYLNSEAVLRLYRTPEFVWGTVPVMLFWVSWMWMQAHRGNMNDDPLIFAVKDKASVLAGLVFAAVLGLGTMGWPW